jgi:hypothetical protein
MNYKPGFYVGLGKMRGSKNGTTYICQTEPIEPGQLDLWLDILYKSIKYYDNDSFVNFTMKKYIKKAANETVNNSSTLQNDNDFNVDLDANSIYEVVLNLAVTGNTGADFKCDWDVGGGASQLTTRCCLGPSINVVAVNDSGNVRESRHDLTTDVTYGTNVSTACHIQERFLVQTTTSGTLQFRWAQNSADASDTICSSNSYMTLEKVS